MKQTFVSMVFFISSLTNTLDVIHICYNLYLLSHNTTGATSGAGTAYHSGAHEFTPVFSGVRVTRSFVLCVCR
jgi:hypothetical protein